MGRILLVDDTIFAKQLLNLILTNGGHEIVGEANDGIEGVEQYKKLKPDLVLMDMIMPRMGGRECMQEILKFDTDAKILIVSADSQGSHVSDTIKEGGRGYISKPYKKETVLEEVDIVLKESRR
ncbi:MAG TPA: response regulator [Methanoregulaceae archaeon]|nr:response regulator [Methanoregulaceae archaeon]